MACGGKGWPFGSSVGRTFGSPFSGYRGDYSVYPDESWKISLRKYPYPLNTPSPARRSRSVSPKKRNVNSKAATRRRDLEEILARIDTTQEDLHALAQKVAAWSREAASLSEGLKEEALLLDLSRQADRLADREEQHRELQKHERVYRLSMENSELRRELRDMIRVCRLLLDRRAQDHRMATTTESPSSPEHAAAAAGAAAQPRGATPAVRHAWQADTSTDAEQQQRQRGGEHRRGGAPPPPVSQARSSAYELSSGDMFAAGLEGLTDQNAAYVVAAARAQAEADADLNRLGPAARREASRAAAAASAAGPGGGGAVSGGRALAADSGRYMKEVSAQASKVGRDVDRERRQVTTALSAVDDELNELTFNLNFQRRGEGRSGGGASTSSANAAGPAAGPVTGARSGAGRSAAPTFGGFLRPEGQAAAAAMSAESTPSVTDAWRRQLQQEHQQQEHLHQQEVTDRAEAELRAAEVARVERELAAAERELAAAVAEQAAAEAAEAEQVAAAAEAAAAAVEASADEDAEVVEVGRGEIEPEVGTSMGTALKLAEGMPVPAPPTPIYQGVPYGSGGAAISTIRRAAPRAQSYSRYGLGAESAAAAGAAAQPLDSVLLTEVEKLKRINKALASTLHSYNRVASRLNDAATGPSVATAATPGAGAARALFGADGGDGGDGSVSLAAVAPPPMAAAVDRQPAASVAATYGRSSAASEVTAALSGYSPSYPLGVSTRAVAAPSTPPPAVRHMRTDEPHVSWAPSTAPPLRGERLPYEGRLFSEARRLDSSLDFQLYGIRQQLQALRHDMVADRLAALAAAAPRGSGGGMSTASAAVAPQTPPKDASAASGSADAAMAAAAADSSGAPTPPYRDVVKLARIEEEVSELRRQMQDDRRWYHDNLDSLTLERSVVFRDLQRRIDRLMASAI